MGILLLLSVISNPYFSFKNNAILFTGYTTQYIEHTDNKSRTLRVTDVGFTNMTLNAGRANAKATPESVFAACLELSSVNPDYTYEDVRHITGGSMSVVAPLVRLYKSKAAVIESCRQLDPSLTISLVESLNRRIEKIEASTLDKLRQFEAAATETIGALTDEIEKFSSLAEEKELTIAGLNQKVSVLESDLTASHEKERISRAELSSAFAQIEKIETELKSQSMTHDERIAALSERHAKILAEEIEHQRKVFEAEKSQALMSKQEEYARLQDSMKNEIGALSALLASTRSNLVKVEAVNSELTRYHVDEIKSKNDIIDSLKNEVQQLNLKLNDSHLKTVELLRSLESSLNDSTKRNQLDIETVHASTKDIKDALSELMRTSDDQIKTRE